MGGICTSLPCIVAVFVLKEVLTYPVIRATANNPLICKVFLVRAHYPLKLTNCMFKEEEEGFLVMGGFCLEHQASPRAATQPLAWPLAVIC